MIDGGLESLKYTYCRQVIYSETELSQITMSFSYYIYKNKIRKQKLCQQQDYAIARIGLIAH